jgi:sugar/nucleoside kinase (ribokinase family)
LPNGVFVGLSTIDIVYAVDESPQSNSKITARSQDVFVGGPATNAAVTFAHLGGHPTLVTAVGSHSLADTISKEVRRHSIKLIELNSNFADAPAISCISVNPAGERNVVSANAFRIPIQPPNVDETILQKSPFVLVDGHYMQACQAWAAAAHARKIRVVLDGGSWKDGTAELIPNVTTAICSEDFLPPGCSSEDDVIAYLQSRGVVNIAITKGDAPIRFHSTTASGSITVPSVEQVDTMGAGDIFHGAFCYFSSQGKGFVEALGEAANIAAESCRYKGTREWMKHYAAQPSLAP